MSTCYCIYSLLDKVCQRFGAGIKMSTGEIVHRGLRYELMPVSMLISAAGSFCLLLKGEELLILSPTRRTGIRACCYFTGRCRYAMEKYGLERYSYSSGLTLPLLASDTPFLALDVLRLRFFGVGDEVRCT